MCNLRSLHNSVEDYEFVSTWHFWQIEFIADTRKRLNMPKFQVSFEVFPPRSLKASFDLWDTAQTLASFTPDFVSVTYGAGGTSADVSKDTCVTLAEHVPTRLVAHVTCQGSSRANTLSMIEALQSSGISDVLALRGDAPKEQNSEPSFECVTDLIKVLRAGKSGTIYVAGYPETHPDAVSPEADIAHLKAKLDAGADEIITQFIFDPEPFLRWRDRVRAAGITAPIRAGILPIVNWEKAERFAKSCGTSIPEGLPQAFTHAARNGETELLSVVQASELCDTLISEGQSALHFYTLNKADLTRQILRALGRAPTSAVAQAA